MQTFGVGKKSLAVFLSALLFVSLSSVNSETAAAASPEPINLGVAGQFSLLAPTITIGGAISVYSAIGALSVASATGEAAVTDPLVAKHFGDPTYVAAMADLTSAISGAFSDTATAIPATVLDAKTFVPGRYYFSAQEVTPGANAVITLDASSNPSGVYIFLFPGNFTPGATVHVMGNADPQKVFWIVQGNFTLGGASSIWMGNVLAGGNITLGNSDILIGRVLAKTAVTTDASQILSGATKPNFALSRSTETGTVGSPIVPITITNVLSSAVSYTISPGLPAGISLNPSTGKISGTPSESQTATSYTITAQSGANTATRTLQLTIYPVVQKSAPTITSVVPISGSTSGGDTITITGTDFRSGATVSVGVNSCAVSSITSIQITCLTSSGLSGSVDVVVTNNDGGVATASNRFTFVVLGDIAQSALTLTIIGGSAGSPILLSTTGGSGSGAITYVVGSSGTATGCVSNTVDSSTASLAATSPGTCSVTATKAGSLFSGSEYYASISSPTVAFTFKGLTQDTLTVTSTSGFFGTPLSLTTTGGNGGGSVTYAVANGSASDCLMPSGKLTSSRAGTCWVTATKAASGNYALINSAPTPIMLVGLSIVFTDITLIDVNIGTAYSDYIKAEARTDGVLTSTVMTYAVDTSTALPAGLSLDTSTGYVTGTLPDGATTGTFIYNFIASTPGFPTQTLAFTVNILPKPPIPAPPVPPVFFGSITSVPLLTIEFTDQTLNPATIGVAYSDYLAARTLSNGSPDSHQVTYALASDSPALPLGLFLNPTTGFVTGTIDASVLPYTENLLFTASSPGYTSITTTSLSYMRVQVVVVDPSAPAVEKVSDVKVETLSFSEDERGVMSFTHKLMMTALFANNSSTLSKAQIAKIKTLSKAMLKMKIRTIKIVGFTNAATGVDNNKLAIARAKTLAEYLKLNNVKQSIEIKYVVMAKTKANLSASALIAMRKAEIWVELK